MDKILIINTGGTFSKFYDEIEGKLIIPKNNNIITDSLLSLFINANYDVEGIIYKDSLDIDDKDREKLRTLISSSSSSKILIIHGTDTMDQTAKYLSEEVQNKTVVLTGAMKPFSIDPTEGTANFSMSFGFLLNSMKKGVFIGMHGIVTEYENIVKNRTNGVFELVF